MTQFEMQLEEEFELGRMEEWSLAGAQQDWGDTLRAASIMALGKSDNSLRIVHNGTHQGHVNPNIRVRDMLRYPGVAERKTMTTAWGIRKTSWCSLPLASFSSNALFRITKVQGEKVRFFQENIPRRCQGAG
jgi:hypothetical protein